VACRRSLHLAPTKTDYHLSPSRHQAHPGLYRFLRPVLLGLLRSPRSLDKAFLRLLECHRSNRRPVVNNTEDAKL
jgi:hypothetical protein